MRYVAGWNHYGDSSLIHAVPVSDGDTQLARFGVGSMGIYQRPLCRRLRKGRTSLPFMRILMTEEESQKWNGLTSRGITGLNFRDLPPKPRQRTCKDCDRVLTKLEAEDE